MSTIYIVNGTSYRNACDVAENDEPAPRKPKRRRMRRDHDSYRAFDKMRERSMFRSKRGPGGGLFTEEELCATARDAFIEDNGRAPADEDELERWATTMLNALAQQQQESAAGAPLIDPAAIANGTKFGDRGDQGKIEDREDHYRTRKGKGSEGRNPRSKKRPLQNPRQIAWGNGKRGRRSKYKQSKDPSWDKAACQKRWESYGGTFEACEQAVSSWAKDPGGYCAHIDDCRKDSQEWRKGPRKSSAERRR